MSPADEPFCTRSLPGTDINKVYQNRLYWHPIFIDVALDKCWLEVGIQGCQMFYFQTKNPNMSKFWRVLQWKMLVYVMDISSILRPLGIFYSLCPFGIYFMAIWYIFYILVCCTKKNQAALLLSIASFCSLII
jgi:hypothetical protein